MKRSILVVDDSETSRMIIRKCFTMNDDESTFWEAEDGIRALSVLASQAIDLVVTDLNMPRMDGLTLVRKLRSGERTRSLPVMVISSMANSSLDHELLDLNVTAIIRKPLNANKIREALGATGEF